MNNSLTKSANDIFGYIYKVYFNWHAILSFVICLIVALLLGRIFAFFAHKVVNRIGAEADKSDDLIRVNRLRRYETLIVLSVAIVKVLLVLLALYFWWRLDHSGTQPTALIGASAVFAIILSASLGSVLRDVTYGAQMMIEQWYGVGDYVKIEPFANMQGVVDRVTLRSTRIRNLNGEVIWVNNQNIQAIRITPKGIRTLALDLFVTDITKGEQLVEKANDRLPIGPLLLVSPLRIVDELQVNSNLWHITIIGETAPGREWLVEQAAVDLIKELDESSHIIEHGPLSRFADADAEKKFKRTINNARKTARKHKKLLLKKPSDTKATYSKYRYTNKK